MGVACGTAMASEALPEFTTITKWTGTTGRDIIESVGKKAISCTSGTSSGEITRAHEGNFTADFKECSSIGVRCNSRGDPAGVILLKGSFDLVRDFKSESTGALLLLFSETHVECSTLVSITLKGDILAPMSPGDETTTKFTLTIRQVAGSQEETKYYNEAEELVSPSAPFLVSINGGGFEQAAAETLEDSVTTERSTDMNVNAIVRPSPNEWVTRFRVGGINPPTTIVTWTVISGTWNPTGRIEFVIVRGGEDPFNFIAGRRPCNRMLNARETCESIVEFNPRRRETFIVLAWMQPFARPLTLEGTGE
ncbi:MAG TPA: hypothetical protein VK272_07425 [Solirubrobacteraceae bacterium]|nr:hypothetical protein [Solirubrobacteraceae bacterium]